ncbi:hypothetical protein [Bacillus sp. ISL-45]|uniref:hypothetical protein n=1 Tax=Bacillus sp. ISL-45 TaxID=2819128 RepID=UPI001BE5F77C|nr:hypothetical protein [Bacillus sp. ISL-45]MBT2663881.1 hypothetical protein [Bacillus sp. ISL-45]
MSKPGIMQHGAVKTFLTRGAFSSVFKPLIYKKEDHVHHDFLNAFLPLIENINMQDNSLRFVTYWLYLIPKELFEEIFITDENGERYLNAVKHSDLKNGALCSYYTQAMAVWHLEQLLNNNEELSKNIGITISDIEYVLIKFYGTKNLTLQYLNEIRGEFDLSKMNVDPRDWGVHYVYSIYDLLINDEQVKYRALKDWDNNLEEEINFITFFIQFFSAQKEQSLAVFFN